MLKRLPAFRGIAEDLRTPMALLPLAPAGPRRTRLVRKMLSRSPFPLPEGVDASSQRIEVEGRLGTRVVTYEAPGRERPSPALVWMHGGGTVIGQPEQANAVCGRWARDLGLLIVSVDYRLAPEHPFPAGVEDCYTALVWLHGNAATLGIDPARIAVGGDSAGGLMAASLSQVARERGGPEICFQLLEYPMLDDRTVLRTDERRWLVWTKSASRFGWTAYLGREPTRESAPPFAAPARTEDLSGLPPTWIGVGDADMLHDEAVDFAGRLRAAGVDCALEVMPGMYHGADSIARSAPTARKFVDLMTEALADGLA